ncbi:amino acid adenylation domain-containing protein [Frankia sp. AgPm24]|uniref:non-ribosomal peptide synthetase n=1 Tax=Frankia sp. AgPm24 TaxID=631128 RepID=UPI00200ECBAB|nr:amino acid adenylation domain-containing protein [Frankia sp. AgPm24]MCK9921114.1 amino acid adenylation domain-containing protein [Frankia sp. AgPm24]
MADSPLLPLSAPQRGVWLAHQLDTSGQEFNCAEYLAIDGPVDVALFRSAWVALSAESDVLRISSVVSDGEPCQVVEPTAAELTSHDWTGSADPEQQAQAWMHADLARPVTLTEPPISTFALLRLSSERYLFYYRMHHVLVDGYSIHLIGRRLAAIYTAMIAGQTAPPAEFASLSTLLEDDVAYRSTPRFDREREYWTGRFADRPAPTRLPGQPLADRADRPLRLCEVDTLTRSEINHLARTAEEIGTTWQILVLAAVAAYTCRVTDQRDVIIGMPVAGRRSVASRRVPGMAMNSVALRLAVRPEESLALLVPRMAEEVRAALRHERYRAEDLRRDLGLEGSGRAFIGPMVNFMPHDLSLRFGASPATTHNLASGPIVDFSLSVLGRDDAASMSLRFEANPDHHDPRGFVRHRDRLMAFLSAVTAEPRQPIGQIEILLAAERQELLDGRGTMTQDGPTATVPELFVRQAARTPDAVALVDAERTWTYAEIDRWSDELAARLVGQGLGPEEFAAVQLARSPELIVAMLAVLKTGAAYVPIDPAYPAERIRYMIDDLAPRCVITAVQPPSEDLNSDLPVGSAGGATAVATPADPANPAYLIYTSGSTGTPKGVMVPHSAVSNFVLDHVRRFELDGSSRVLQYVSPSFDVATGDIWPVLLAGGRLVLAPEGQSTSPEALVALLEAERITHAAIPPAMLAQLPDAGLPHLGVLITGGEPPSAEAVRRWSAGRRMINVYGVTEATVASTTSQLVPGQPPAVGRPIDNCQVYVLDSGLAPLPEGSTGGLYLAGDGLARGYLSRPALTAERFLPCPYGPPGSRMYATGDRVRWRSDGALEFRERIDDQVKIRGFRVELGEVEAVLAGHPSVRAAVVVAREDRPGRRRLVAYVQPAVRGRATPARLRRFAARSLPDFMVPATVMLLDAFPVTPNGKVDRRSLAAPEPTGMADSSVRPRAGSREETLCALFAEALGVDEVGVHDSFFDLGGDSTMVFPLVRRAPEVGLTFTAREVFQHPTVAALAPIAHVAETHPVVRSAGGPAAFSLTVEQVDAIRAAHPGLTEVLPVSPLQEAFIFHNAAGRQDPTEPSRDAYASQVHLDLDGPLDPAAMRSAGEALLHRHPNLRVAFVHGDLPAPVQVVCANVALPWAEVDLSGLAEDERDTVAQRRAADERDGNWDMARPPLMRLLLLKLSDDRHRLVLTAHHVLWDGWSTSILIRELFTLYTGGALPPAPPYRHYLDWLAARDRTASRQIWATALTGLRTPTQVAPGFIGTGRQEQIRRGLTQDLTEALIGWGRSHGLTLYTLVQGAWALVLSQLTGADDVVFGSSVSGRPPELPGVEDMVGLLTNTIPVRVRLRAGELTEALLARLQAEQAELIPHHYLGLGDIQRQTSAGPRLFDTTILFGGLPVDPVGWSETLDGLKLAGFDVSDDTHYPLRLIVAPGPRLHLRLGYHPAAFRPAEAERLLDRLVTTFETIATGVPR